MAEVKVEHPSVIRRVNFPPLFAGKPGGKKRFFSLGTDEKGVPLVRIGNPNEKGEYTTLFFKAEAGELMNLAEALEIYRLEGFSAFKAFAQRINPATPLNKKDEYASLTFVHRSEGQNSVTNNVFALVVMQSKQGESLQFRLSKKVTEGKDVVEDLKVSFPLSFGEVRKLEKMFGELADVAFHNEVTKATLQELKREEELRAKQEAQKEKGQKEAPEDEDDVAPEVNDAEDGHDDYSVDELLEGDAPASAPEPEPAPEKPKRSRRRGMSMSMG